MHFIGTHRKLDVYGFVRLDKTKVSSDKAQKRYEANSAYTVLLEIIT